MHEELLILTVGLPHSGKSTWSRKQGFPIVNPDSIRLALHGKAFIPEAEDFVWTIAYTMAKALFLAGHDKVIIDATNITEKRRQAWVKRFPRKKVKYKLFPTLWDVCFERAMSNGRPDLANVIKFMEKERVAECGDRPIFVDVPISQVLIDEDL